MTQGFCSSVIGDVCQVRGEFNARGSPPGMGLPGCPEGSRCKNKKDTPFGVCEAEKQVGKAGCTDTTCPDGPHVHDGNDGRAQPVLRHVVR